MELGVWAGGRRFCSKFFFVVGYVAASGGMVEHFVSFTEYPVKFALITFIEILVQVIIMGPWTVLWIESSKR